MNRTILSTAAILGAAMAGMGQSAEVVPRPTGLGAWMDRNNRHMFPKRKKAKPVRRARLQRATGPGSLNEANELRTLVEAGKEAEAAKYYEACRNINYRAGRPKLRWGDVWYHAYTVRRAAR